MTSCHAMLGKEYWALRSNEISKIPTKITLYNFCGQNFRQNIQESLIRKRPKSRDSRQNHASQGVQYNHGIYLHMTNISLSVLSAWSSFSNPMLNIVHSWSQDFLEGSVGVDRRKPTFRPAHSTSRVEHLRLLSGQSSTTARISRKIHLWWWSAENAVTLSWGDNDELFLWYY